MKLDWKWIGIGTLIMLALGLAAGIVTALVLGPAIEGAPEIDIEEIPLSSGQAVRTILEPGISAAVAVIVVLAFSGALSIVNIIAGGLVPFVAGVLGGWLGERRQTA